MYNSEQIFLIIPCYNEVLRLRLEEFKNYSNKIYFIFVDDGSFDNTYQLLINSNIHNSFVLKLKKNSGKGEAIRQGMLYLLNNYSIDNNCWVGFWDADLATPLSEVFAMIKFDEILYNKLSDAIFGSRVYRLGATINRSSIRHILGRCFITFISFFLNIDSYDSQCGAKIFKKNIAENVFNEAFISNWVFDIELLLRLRNNYVIEYPLKKWTDVDGSKINILKILLRVISDVWKIKKYYHKH